MMGAEPLRGLEDVCGVCKRPVGDHTMREWSACMGTTPFHMPYEATPDDAAALVSEEIRRRFHLDPDLIVCDTVVIRSATLEGESGPLGVKLPCLVHEFQIGRPTSAPMTVAKVLYCVGHRDHVRGSPVAVSVLDWRYGVTVSGCLRFWT